MAASIFERRDNVGNGVVIGVQYLRGICALLVVISHENGFLNFPEYFGSMPLPSLHEASVFAVAVFFAISGFIIVVTAMDSTGRPAMAPREFLWRRAVRILPFLWLVTIGYNFLSWAGTGLLDGQAVIRTLTLWPIGELKPNVAWSLRHEMVFYGIFAVTMLARPRWGWVMAAWILFTPLAFLLVFDVPHYTLDMATPGFELFRLIAMGGDNGANLQFGAGMLLGFALLWVRKNGISRGALGRAVPAWAMLVAIMLAGGLIVAIPLESGLLKLALWTVLAGLILQLAIAAKALPGRAGQLALALGNASFSIYLVHNPVMLIILAVSKKVGVTLPGTAIQLAYLAFCVTISLIAGYAVHRMVERPLIRYVEGWRRRQMAG